jgi:hypothetical protein
VETKCELVVGRVVQGKRMGGPSDSARPGEKISHYVSFAFGVLGGEAMLRLSDQSCHLSGAHL